MDDIDKKILAELQVDGRLTVTELAERVNLSVSPCHRRLRALEADKVITGYRALIDPSSVGHDFSTIVFVTLRDGDNQTMTRFEEELEQVPEVVRAVRMFGEPDYLLVVWTHDVTAFQHLYDERLSALAGVQRLTSTIVMKTVVPERSVPL